MGGKKKQLETGAQDAASNAIAVDQPKADALQQDLQQRKNAIAPSIAPTASTVTTGGTDLATTGGFTPEDKTNFVRSATAPVNAVYDRANDELNRSKMTGGYSPGFDASAARLTRQKAEAGSTAGLNANVQLHNAVNQGKVAGQDILQKYLQYGSTSLNNDDITQLRNRAQTGQLTQYDSQLLAQLSTQHNSLWQNITQGIGQVSGAVGSFVGV